MISLRFGVARDGTAVGLMVGTGVGMGVRVAAGVDIGSIVGVDIASFSIVAGDLRNWIGLSEENLAC